MGFTHINTKRVIALFAVLVIIGAFFVSCGGRSKTPVKKSEEDQVRFAVETRASIAYWSMTIGGNDLKSSSARITNVQKLSASEYKVSGVMTVVDIYGTRWTNTFDCSVQYDDNHVDKEKDGWTVKDGFQYKSEYWSK